MVLEIFANLCLPLVKAKRVYLWTLPCPTIKPPEAERERVYTEVETPSAVVLFGVLPAVGHKNLLNLATL